MRQSIGAIASSRVSRRGFLAGAGAVGLAAAGALSGCGPVSPEQSAGDVAVDGVPQTWDMECDVLVCGGGGAGSAVAYAAAAEGAEVLVLESRDMTDLSSTCICAGNYFAVGTDEQEAAGIEDDPDLAFDAIMEWGLCAYGSGHANREEVVRTYVDNSRDAYDLLKSLGIEFPAPIPYDGIEPPRVHTIDPAAMQRALLEGAEQAGATVLLNTEFTDLIVDGNDMVVGVRAKDSSGATIAVKARKGVALATGGMSRCPTFWTNASPFGRRRRALVRRAHGCRSLRAVGHRRGHLGSQRREHRGGGSRKGARGGWPRGDYGNVRSHHRGYDGLRYVDESSAWSGERTRALLPKERTLSAGSTSTGRCGTRACRT